MAPRMQAASSSHASGQLSSSGSPSPIARDRGVAIWLWCLAACVFAMVVVGGSTRLTESGLSITQWKPIEGVIPPLSQADWTAAFNDYRATPQFAKLFPDMTLDQFKGVFMWEWSHRLLGRLIGFVVAGPLLWFWIKKRIDGKLARGLVVVLALGGFQGLVGWLMVKSGLVDRVEVAPQMLATHLLLASTLFIVLVAMAIGGPTQETAPIAPRLRKTAAVLPFLILAQLGLGALVAGSRAGLIDNTWPLMEGGFVPSVAHLFNLTPGWSNWFENRVLVQFDHRMMAYLVTLVALWHAFDARRCAPGSRLARRALTLVFVVLAQVALGVMTLELAVPIWAGLLHQAFAMALLAKAVIHWRKSRAPADASALTADSAVGAARFGSA